MLRSPRSGVSKHRGRPILRDAPSALLRMRRSNRRHAHLKVTMSADRLELSIALSDNENTRPILDGDVTAEMRWTSSDLIIGTPLAQAEKASGFNYSLEGAKGREDRQG